MSEAELDRLIDAMAALLDLPVTDEYWPGVRFHLAIAARLAKVVEELPLPDEAEPAPVFEP